MNPNDYRGIARLYAIDYDIAKAVDDKENVLVQAQDIFTDKVSLFSTLDLGI